MFNDLNGYLMLAEKIFAILGSLIYFVFALVVVKQVGTMSRNVRDKINSILISVSYLHLAASILLVFLAWTIL
ncbi:MAG: DUF5657 family protein [Candidatus Shapirobacteria bacterium]